jgi:ribosomal protein L37AE/L43A
MTDALLDPLDILDPRLVTNNRASKGDNKRKLNEQANGEEVAPDEKPNDEPKRTKLNLWKCRCCQDARKKVSQ